jgi:hypothetical protein
VSEYYRLLPSIDFTQPTIKATLHTGTADYQPPVGTVVTDRRGRRWKHEPGYWMAATGTEDMIGWADLVALYGPVEWVRL